MSILIGPSQAITITITILYNLDFMFFESLNSGTVELLTPKDFEGIFANDLWLDSTKYS